MFEQTFCSRISMGLENTNNFFVLSYTNWCKSDTKTTNFLWCLLSSIPKRANHNQITFLSIILKNLNMLAVLFLRGCWDGLWRIEFISRKWNVPNSISHSRNHHSEYCSYLNNSIMFLSSISFFLENCFNHLTAWLFNRFTLIASYLPKTQIGLFVFLPRLVAS